LILKD